MNEGLLRRIPPSRERAFRSIEKSESWLKKAEKTLKSEAFNSSVLASYMVMFHSARAILFFEVLERKVMLALPDTLKRNMSRQENLKRNGLNYLITTGK